MIVLVNCYLFGLAVNQQPVQYLEFCSRPPPRPFSQGNIGPRLNLVDDPWRTVCQGERGQRERGLMSSVRSP